MSQALIKKCKKFPTLTNRVDIEKSEFDSILTNSDLFVVEKTFFRHLECHRVLFVIDGENIKEIYVQQNEGKFMKTYKQVNYV